MYKKAGRTDMNEKNLWISFYGCLDGDLNGQEEAGKRIYEFFKWNKTKPKQFWEVRIDVAKTGMAEEDVEYGQRFSQQTKDFRGFQDSKRQRRKDRRQMERINK